MASTLYKKVRILCMIPSSDDDLRSKGKAILETWGSRCTKILFFTNEDVPGYSAIGLHINEEGSYDMTKKVFKAFYYTYVTLINEYDWFLKADMDTYVVMENLRYMLMDKNPNEPLYYGLEFKVILI